MNTNPQTNNTEASERAGAIGFQGARVATAEDDSMDRCRPLLILGGSVLQAFSCARPSSAGWRADVIEEIENYLRRIVADRPEVLDRENLPPEVREACEEWLEDLRAALAEQPGAVRAGIEAWVDEYIDGQGLDPMTGEARD